MTWRIRGAGVVAILLGTMACAATTGDDGSFQPFKALIPDISVEQERLVGAQADAQIRAQLIERNLLVDDPEVVGWINDLGNAIVQHLGDRNFQYRFRVLREQSLNAFALPGGYIFFHSGTILEAHDLDELVGVLAHEIAHSRRHHWARGVEANAMPDLIAGLVGAGLTAATGEIAPLIIAQGVSQSLRLSYTREFEAEADQVGTAFMVRAGYDPLGMAVFFERLVAKYGRPGRSIPPYLLSHPRADVRAQDAVDRAEKTTIPGKEDPALRARFRDIQYRLSVLVAEERTTLRPELPTPDRAFVERTLTLAEERIEADDLPGAASVLREAEAREPYDPRLPFRLAEILEQEEAWSEAVAAYTRAMNLDPTRAVVHFRLGRAHRKLGNDARAVFHLEQAQSRFVRPGPLPKETARMLKRLTFPLLLKSGLSDGVTGAAADTPVGGAVEEFAPDPRVLVWWGEVDPAWNDRREELEIRWLDPVGAEVHRGVTEKKGKAVALHRFEPPPGTVTRAGIWQAEVWLDDERADRTTFRVAAPAR